MALFHADIRLPDGFRLPNRVVELEWTKHADGARYNDRYGIIPPLPIVDLGKCETVEVEVTGKRVNKVVVRTELDEHFDVVLVLIPGSNKWVVKTAWLNEWDDTHKTLDRSKYVC